MSIITDLIGGGIVKEVGQVIDDLTTSDEERAQAELEAQKLENQLLIGQQEINKAEAQHASLFVAGWRPYIGWICGTALGLIYIPQAIVKAALWTYQAIVVVHAWNGAGALPALPTYPEMGVADLIALLLALLGMAGMRSNETLKGVERNEPLTPFKVRNPFKRTPANPANPEAP